LEAQTVRTLSFKLPDELARRLDALAKRRRTNRSEVIRAALEAFDPARGESFTVAAADLVGSLVGPKDLATSGRRPIPLVAP
jgi:predicted DNA-binding protein